MKYYVQVNRHLMTSVEADSALSAEHLILDLDGIQYSNAFDNEGRKTDTFRGALLDCQTISINELRNLSAAYTLAWQEVVKAKDQIITATHEVERIEKMLEEARKQETDARRAYCDYLREAKQAKAALLIEDE